MLILWMAGLAKGFGSPYWLTVKQAIKIGAHVRKDDRGEVVVYYGRAVRTRTDGAGAEIEDAFRFLKSYVVFNADQIAGLPPQYHPAPPTQTIMPLAAHEA